MDTMRNELGSRVYDSAIFFGFACAGLIVLLTLRCLIGGGM
jgi:hypothetical protein